MPNPARSRPYTYMVEMRRQILREVMAEGISYRQMARRVGMAFSPFLRFLHGGGISARNLEKLIEWQRKGGQE